MLVETDTGRLVTDLARATRFLEARLVLSTLYQRGSDLS